MATRITIQLDDDAIAALDTEVAAGRARGRADAVRRGIARLQRDQRYRVEEQAMLEVLQRGESLYPDLWASDGELTDLVDGG